jgi:hypothetical protein
MAALIAAGTEVFFRPVAICVSPRSEALLSICSKALFSYSVWIGFHLEELPIGRQGAAGARVSISL